jgi:hypothetical protein
MQTAGTHLAPSPDSRTLLDSNVLAYISTVELRGTSLFASGAALRFSSSKWLISEGEEGEDGVVVVVEWWWWCRAALRFAALCLCCAALRCAALCCTVLRCVVLRCVALCCAARVVVAVAVTLPTTPSVCKGNPGGAPGPSGHLSPVLALLGA